MSKTPQCPRCGERDRLTAWPHTDNGKTYLDYFCERCVGWIINLSPLPGKHTPDDIGPPVKRKRYRKGSTPRLTGEAQERGMPLTPRRGGPVNQ